MAVAGERTSHSEAETVALGETFMRDHARLGMVVAIYGELGAGKTHFVKGIARVLGIDERQLTSPTYALVNEYECSLPNGEAASLYHLDCYRFENPGELIELGVEDYLMPHHAITVIEWAERIEKFLPDSRIDIRIEPASDTERTITIQELTQ
jgi:tRNA threonylcarbamoyladenosine biosynthesis protein TsaE